MGSYLFNLRHNNNNNNNEIILDTPQNTRKVYWHLHSFFLYHRPISAGEFPVHLHPPLQNWMRCHPGPDDNHCWHLDSSEFQAERQKGQDMLRGEGVFLEEDTITVSTLIL